MKPTERLAEATAPDGTRLTLLRHDGAYMLHADGKELMSTRRSHSEIALAELACGAIVGRGAPRVLVGGLGFGFTLRAALQLLPPGADVVVAELVQAVIDWNLAPEYSLGGDALRDPRVSLRHADVLDVLRENSGGFDAIMLDVDNGAEAFTTAGNAPLYGEGGIRTTIAALRPGGVVAYWSAGDDAPFVRALRRAGLTATTHRSRTHRSARTQHTIILARLGAPTAGAAPRDAK